MQSRVTALAPDGKLLAVGEQGIRVVELPSGKERVKLAGHSSHCTCLAFGPGGKILVSGGEETSQPKNTYSVKLWNLSTGKELAGFHTPSNTRLSVSPALQTTGMF